MAFFERLKAGLTNTRTAIKEQIDNVFKAFKSVDEELFEELEEILITADVGAQTSIEIIEMLREFLEDNPEYIDLLGDSLNGISGNYMDDTDYMKNPMMPDVNRGGRR